MKKTMKPLGTRVLLRRPPITEQIGRIHIPEKYRHAPLEGTVIAIGPGVTTVQVGDVVLHGRHNTIEVPGAPDLRLAWERDLMAILEEGGAMITEDEALDAMSALNPMLLGPKP